MAKNQTLEFFHPITKKIVPLTPIEEGHVRIYSCGPTVYDYAHIGNYRAFLFSDFLHRSLLYFGFRVTRVMNITDIDDKTIDGATKKGISLKQFTTPYEEALFHDLDLLGSLPATHYPRATNYIDDMIAMIKTLIKKKHAYEKDGSVYFRLESFPDYGKLSHIKQEMQQEGASGRIFEDEYNKENIADFVLWKAVSNENEIARFPSPFGFGRPGWHIECSAMSKHFLGKHFDIHTGGIDNRFPHHENEIAQSESCNGTTMANHWLHVAHLQVESEKMSKSLGNFLTLRHVLKQGIPPQTLRYMLLSTHYRNPYNFTIEGADAANKALSRLARCQSAVKAGKKETTDSLPPSSKNNLQASPSENKSILTPFRSQFSAALASDLNASAALAAVFDGVTAINIQLSRLKPQRNSSAYIFYDDALQFLAEVNNVFGFLPPPFTNEIPTEVLQLQKKRDLARAEKNFQESDELRKKIDTLGFTVTDSTKGSEIHAK